MGPGGPLGLIMFDANQDGRITRAEFDAGQRSRFNELDADRNGTVTREEMRAAAEARRTEAQNARFTRLDTDKNGQLSKTELDAGRTAAKESPRGDGGRHMGGRLMRHGPPGGRDGQRANGQNGQATGDAPQLTFETFSKRGLDGFTRADANNDQVVTIAELQSLGKR
jgi:hypothetical protein